MWSRSKTFPLVWILNFVIEIGRVRFLETSTSTLWLLVSWLARRVRKAHHIGGVPSLRKYDCFKGFRHEYLWAWFSWSSTHSEQKNIFKSTIFSSKPSASSNFLYFIQKIFFLKYWRRKFIPDFPGPNFLRDPPSWEKFRRESFMD